MATQFQGVNTEDECRAVLHAAFSGLAIESLGYLAEGWDSTVFAVNDRHVFRFPKRAGVDATLRKEIQLLPALVPVLPTAVPDFDFVSSPTTTYAWHIVGYQKLPGTPADEYQWTPGAIAAIAPALTAFLHALHAFPVDRAAALGAPSYPPRAWLDRHRALYATARDAAEPHLPVGTFARFVAHWEQMLAEDERFDFVPVLIHGDLAMEHVLIDEEGGLSGVIDFGDAMVADPALDFAGFPDTLARRVLHLYGEDPAARDGIWLRRELYRQAGPLHEIWAGAELGRADLLRSGIEDLGRTHG